MHFLIRCWFLEFVLAKMNIYCSLKEQYSQAVIRTKYVQISRIVESGLLLCTMDRSVSGYIVQRSILRIWKKWLIKAVTVFFCSFRFKEPVMAQCLLFLKPITYLSFPSTDHCSLSSIFLWLANRSFVCWSMCLYCLH